MNKSYGITVKDGFFFFLKGWPSQWFPSRFSVGGVTFSCCEQYMMAEKARMFGDEKSYELIMASDNPSFHKTQGRKVLGFDEARWLAEREAVVLRGNLAKFSQNADLREALLETGDLVIAEAAHYDKVWGIGLSATDPRAAVQAQWPGKNLLGKAVMRVRESLRSDSQVAAARP